MVEEKSTSRFKQDIVEINGVKQLRIIVDGSTIVYKDIPKEGESTEEVEEVATPVVAVDPEWKFACVPCEFFTNDEDLYNKHMNSKAHKKIMEA